MAIYYAMPIAIGKQNAKVYATT